MVLERLSPGVQHAEETDLRAEVLWLGGDLTQRLRGRLEQDVVDHGLVLEGDDLDLRRHGEHHVEVGRVEQFRSTVLEPLGSCEALALWTIAVATCNGHRPLPALWANSVMGSWRAALFSLVLLRHHFALHYRGIPEQGDQLVWRPEGSFA